jgi:hypothetical protein
MVGFGQAMLGATITLQDAPPDPVFSGAGESCPTQILVFPPIATHLRRIRNNMRQVVGWHRSS